MNANTIALFSALSACLLTAGCDGNATGADRQASKQGKYDDTCLLEGGNCYDDQTACCAGTFCSWDTDAYGVAICAPTLDNGGFCWDDSHCTSGSCSDDGVCGDPVLTCIAVGDTCDWAGGSLACCEGTFCSLETNVYAPIAVCNAPQPDGAYCNGDHQCETGSCTDSVCGEPAPTCAAVGTSCDWGSSLACCDDSFCSLELNVYGPAVCTAAQPDGNYCNSDQQCEGGSCVNGQCATPAQCRPLGDYCYDDTTSCCGPNHCSFDTSAYGLANCVAPREPGDFCSSDEQCGSGACSDDGVCVAPAAAN